MGNNLVLNRPLRIPNRGMLRLKHVLQVIQDSLHPYASTSMVFPTYGWRGSSKVNESNILVIVSIQQLLENPHESQKHSAYGLYD